MRRSFLSLFVACLTVASVLAQPKLEVVGGPVVNWGTVNSKQSPLKAKVKIVNSGNEELKISKVHAACGCTATLLDKDLLKPGDTATIDVSLNIRGRSGSVTKTVTISSNDPKQPRKVLYLKAVVRDPVTISTGVVTFKTSHPDFSSFQVMAYGNVKKAEEQSKVFEKPSNKK